MLNMLRVINTGINKLFAIVFFTVHWKYLIHLSAFSEHYTERPCWLFWSFDDTIQLLFGGAISTHTHSWALSAIVFELFKVVSGRYMIWTPQHVPFCSLSFFEKVSRKEKVIRIWWLLFRDRSLNCGNYLK